MDNVVLVGNPGVGKSCLLNSMTRRLLFRSGVSIGAGLTDCLESHEVSGVRYYDTPGLDDLEKRERAAEQIAKCLRKGGKFKVIFVCTLESGRSPRSSDLRTMKVILDGIEAIDIDMENKFSVLINKVGSVELNFLQQEKYREIIRAQFCKVRNFQHMGFIPYFPAADCKDSEVLLDCPEEWSSFLKDAPLVDLPIENTIEVDATAAEEYSEELGKELCELRKQLEEATHTKPLWRELLSNAVTGFTFGASCVLLNGAVARVGGAATTIATADAASTSSWYGVARVLSNVVQFWKNS